MTSLITHLRQARLKKNLTQEELAKRCGVSRKTINVLENQNYVPSTLLALRLARELETPVEALFALPDEEKSTN